MPATKEAPPPAASPLEQIANDPVPITLLDGTTIEIRFTFTAIADLERHFGSYRAVLEALDGDADRQSYTELGVFLFAGLVTKTHTVSAPDEWQQVTVSERAWTHEDLLAALDPKRFTEYALAVQEASRRAFPTVEEDAAAKAAAAAGNAAAQ